MNLAGRGSITQSWRESRQNTVDAQIPRTKAVKISVWQLFMQYFQSEGKEKKQLIMRTSPHAMREIALSPELWSDTRVGEVQ